MELTELKQKIRTLLKEKNGILLAHYYQRDEVQEIADFTGDSLALSFEAAKTKADVIVFAGVHFMAESASILSPEKTVLLPRLEAGCALADTITVEALEAEKKKYPDAAVVTYINSSAAIKAASDICCTSANAVRVVQSLSEKRVLMIPDGNLARYTAKFTDKEIIPWGGTCPVHQNFSPEEVLAAKARHPGAKFAAHPECREEVLTLADLRGEHLRDHRLRGKDGGQRAHFRHRDGHPLPAPDEIPRKDLHPGLGNDDLRHDEAHDARGHPEGPHGHGARGEGARGNPDSREEVSRQDAGGGVSASRKASASSVVASGNVLNPPFIPLFQRRKEGDFAL